MKISIVTVVRNNRQVSEALDSILAQKTRHEIEMVVIDGASTDGTREILERYRERLGYFISEPDKGIYHAMNKGLSAATGEIVGILNSDDFYASDQVLETVGNAFVEGQTDAVFGDLVYVDAQNTSRVVRYWRGLDYKKGAFRNGWHPPHPTFFVRRDLYKIHGLFDLSFKLAADFELMIRYIEKEHVRPTYIPVLMVKMRLGGASNKSLSNMVKANVEDWRAFKKNGIFVTPFYYVAKGFSRFGQFFHSQG